MGPGETALTEVPNIACTTTGLALLVAPALIRCRDAWWVETEALRLHHDGRHLLRRRTTRYEVHEELWSPPARYPKHCREWRRLSTSGKRA